MVRGEAGAAAQREPQPHAERSHDLPVVPAACATPSAQPRSQHFPRHPGDPRGPSPSPRLQGWCRGSCRQPDEKLCYRSDHPKYTSVPRAGPIIPQRGRQPGSTSCLHQLLCKPYPRRLATSSHQEHCPLAGTRSPFSLPCGDCRAVCKGWWSISRVMQCYLTRDGASHKWWSVVSRVTEHRASDGVLSNK